jgi:hypothetical protein
MTLSAPLIAPAASRAGIVTIDPFTGDHSEDFNNLNSATTVQSLSIFGGFATMQNTTSGGALKYVLASKLGSELVTARSAPFMAGQIGISLWTFSDPVSDFGGYFENNSRLDNAVITFFGVNGTTLGSLTVTDPKAAQAWTWNGWHSDTPIKSVTVSGNDSAFFHGFIWFDDFQLNVAPVSAPAPEPGSWALLATAGLAAVPWTLRRRKPLT